MKTILPALLVVVLLSHCASEPESRETGVEFMPIKRFVLGERELSEARTGPVDFVKHVKPVLEERCVVCHNRKVLKGHMNLDDQSAALRSGAIGTYMVPGHPEVSMFANLVEMHRGHSVMPMGGIPLTKGECDVLAKWIKEGPIWPAGEAGTLTIRR